MLKFDKEAKLSIRKKESLWQTPFLVALLLALTIHAGALLIFHIEPFKAYFSFLFPPIQVNFSQNQMALLEEKKEEQFHLLDSYEPQFPSFKTVQEDKFAILTNESNDFLIDPLGPLEISFKPLKITVSGPLAQRKLLAKEKEIMVKKKGPLQKYFVEFEVYIDPTTGFIIWFNKKTSSPIDLEAEKQLLKLQFEPDDRYDRISGLVQVVITK